jgi:hypothetical protein
MTTITQQHDGIAFMVSSKPASLNTWHLWTVIIPRRSITGRLVRGQVWRRHDGRHWIYKRFLGIPASSWPRASASDLAK